MIFKHEMKQIARFLRAVKFLATVNVEIVNLFIVNFGVILAKSIKLNSSESAR